MHIASVESSGRSHRPFDHSRAPCYGNASGPHGPETTLLSISPSHEEAETSPAPAAGSAAGPGRAAIREEQVS